MCSKRRKRLGAWLFVVCAVLSWAMPCEAELVLYLPLDEAAGTEVAGLSENGHMGTRSGDPVFVQGMIDMGMTFDAVDDQVVVPSHPSLDITDKITLSAWIKPGPNLTADWRTVMGKSPTSVLGQTTFSYDIRTDNTGRIQFSLNIGGWQRVDGPTLVEDTWYHVLGTYDGQQLVFYVDGTSIGTTAASGQINVTSNPFCVGNIDNNNEYWSGIIDDVRIYNEALTEAEVGEVMLGAGPGVVKTLAAKPLPENEAADVLREVTLTWIPGESAIKHNVYLGTAFDDVTSADADHTVGVLANLGQTETSFDAGVLQFGQTYFWRVDEVNAAPDNTIFKGNVWSFEVEPYSIEIPGSTITVTASSVSNEFSMPEKTIDGSGLDGDDVHATTPETMWFTATVDLDPWIQYDFNDVMKLDTMSVWNANSTAESAIGWGVKDVVIEYSVDGEHWDVLADANQLSRAPGLPTYSQYDTIDFGGATARYVRLDIQSNWGGILMAYGLSEVQFSMIPVQARTPEPASGAVDIHPDTTVAWRAGREASQHTVSVSMDINALADGTAASAVSMTNSLDLTSLDLGLGETYYWQVDEVNDTEVPSVWTGPVWSLSTTAALVVEDFERYGNISPYRPFQTWLDGFGYSADEFFPVDYLGNGTGSGVGHDIWSVSSPHFDGKIMEDSIVKSGGQSMPLYFNNTNGLTLSETERTLDSAQDWTAHGIKSLSLSIHGDPGNSGQLYLKINGTRVDYEGLPDALQRQQWTPWNVDLSKVAGDLQTVQTLTIGLEGAGATGLIYVDDIRLYPLTPETFVPVPPDAGDPNLVAFYAFEGNANDSTGNYDGTISGAPTYIAGKFGQAMTFNGSSDYVIHAFAQETVWPAYSVSLWTRTDIFGQAQFKSVFNNNSSSSDFQIDVDGSDPGNYRYQGSLGGIIGPVTSDWVHLAVCCDGTETRLYYNGLLAGIVNAVNTNFGQLAIGINRGLNQPFAGSIDDVRVYDRSLSEAEVAGLAGLTEPVPTSF